MVIHVCNAARRSSSCCSGHRLMLARLPRILASHEASWRPSGPPSSPRLPDGCPTETGAPGSGGTGPCQAGMCPPRPGIS
eukprot:6767765-Heterocapsa_arctica.AAC.1